MMIGREIFNSLSAKVSLALIAVLTLLLGASSFNFINWSTRTMEESLLGKGRSAAVTGAGTIGHMLDNIADEGFFSMAELLDTDYKAIPGSDPVKYHTAYDSFLENRLLAVQEEFLKDKDFVYSVAVDRNGYVPVHNMKYQKPLTGDYKKDLEGNRTKRIYNDPVGIKAAQNVAPYIFQNYHRDTGETIWDISAPIWIKGRHWGAFRVGISVNHLNAKVASLRNSLIAAVMIMIIMSCASIYVLTRRMFMPVSELAKATEIIANGDLDYRVEMEHRKDELGDLAIDFNSMTLSLRTAFKEKERLYNELQKYTRELEQKVVNLEIKIDEKKKEKAVEEITGTDYFRQLAEKAEKLRDGL